MWAIVWGTLMGFLQYNIASLNNTGHIMCLWYYSSHSHEIDQSINAVQLIQCSNSFGASGSASGSNPGQYPSLRSTQHPGVPTPPEPTGQDEVGPADALPFFLHTEPGICCTLGGVPSVHFLGQLYFLSASRFALPMALFLSWSRGGGWFSVWQRQWTPVKYSEPETPLLGQVGRIVPGEASWRTTSTALKRGRKVIKADSNKSFIVAVAIQYAFLHIFMLCLHTTSKAQELFGWELELDFHSQCRRCLKDVSHL